MCEFDELYFSREGYVIYCKECHYYQVCYGTAVLTLTGADLAALYHSLGDLMSVHQDCSDDELKQILVPTPYEGAHLLLSVRELNQFHTMLDQVSDEVAALSMIALF